VALGWAASRPARVRAMRAKGGDMTDNLIEGMAIALSEAQHGNLGWVLCGADGRESWRCTAFAALAYRAERYPVEPGDIEIADRLRATTAKALQLVSDQLLDEIAAVTGRREWDEPRDIVRAVEALRAERDAALAEVARLKAELLREADKHFAGARAVLEDALGEGERVRRPVVCETCDGEGWLHEDPIVDGAVPACPDCGNDGCGPGVRWET